MNEPLFHKLLASVQEFLRLVKEAPGKRSSYGKAHGEPTSDDLAVWQQFIEYHENAYHHLMKLLESGLEANREAIDTELDAFRSLSRYFSEVACHWSAYYEEIREKMIGISRALYAIDVKYKLGDEKYC